MKTGFYHSVDLDGLTSGGGGHKKAAGFVVKDLNIVLNDTI